MVESLQIKEGRIQYRNVEVPINRNDFAKWIQNGKHNNKEKSLTTQGGNDIYGSGKIY